MDSLDDKLGTIAILDVGGVHLGTDQLVRRPIAVATVEIRPRQRRV
jgi:hypothetical protein